MIRLMVVVAMFVAIMGASPAKAASILSSKHNFASSAAGTTASNFANIYSDSRGKISQVCVFCHTPHNSSKQALYAEGGVGTPGFLWNRSLSPGNAYGYKPYTSASTTFTFGDPTGISLMCMSCHDGVASIAIGMLLNSNGVQNPVITNSGPYDAIGEISWDCMGAPLIDCFPSIASPWLNIGNGYSYRNGTVTQIDMSNDHPVSINYSDFYNAMPTDFKASPSDSKLRLFGGKMECSTCHAVHDPAIPPFLSMSNAGSAMCLACHVK